MTDDELEARLKRLDARPDADWDAMAAAVRDGYARATSERATGDLARAAARRRRRWLPPIAGALALAAGVTLFVRAHHARLPAAAPTLEDEMTTYEPDTDELIDELTPAQLERVAKAFNKGA